MAISLASILPSRMYVETSIFVGAVVQGPDDSAACLSFVDGLREANTQVVYSELMRLEFANAVAELARSTRRRGELPEEIVKEFALDRWSTDPAVRSHWLQFGMTELDSLLGSFYVDEEIPIDDLVIGNALEMMVEHDLRSYDAVHVATARLQSVRHLATCDGGFQSAAPLTKVVLVRDGGITGL